jgi:hypothetical protein
MALVASKSVVPYLHRISDMIAAILFFDTFLSYIDFGPT